VLEFRFGGEDGGFGVGREGKAPRDCNTEAFRYLSATMQALVIKSFPEALHAKLRKLAAAPLFGLRGVNVIP